MLVAGPIVEEITLMSNHRAFHEDHVRNLARDFPFFFRREDRLVGAPDQPAWVVAVEYRDPGAVNQLVISAVVDQHNSARRKHGRRAGLNHARVEHPWPPWEDRSIRSLGPVQQIG